MKIRRQQLVGSVGTLALTGLAIGAMGLIDEWLGDVVALLWLVGVFLFPWLAGMGLRQRAAGLQGRIGGAFVSALVVAIPMVATLLIQDPDLDAIQLPLLLALFVPLSLALGAIAMPVGGTVLRR